MLAETPAQGSGDWSPAAAVSLGETDLDNHHYAVSMSDMEEFQSQREKLQAIMMEKSDKTMKRFLNLDTQVYTDGVLSAREKELLGLVSSLVLRCDDCINYHLIQCHKMGMKEDELVEALSVGLIVGGSITIPHIRRALKAWDSLEIGQ